MIISAAWVVILIWIVSILLATHLGIKKGLPILSFINGLVLGPIGVFIVMIQDSENRVSCPSCAELILKAAKICPYCRLEVKN